METRSTSFGEMTHLLKLDGKVSAEYLVFKKSGRKHRHPDYESFFVMAGTGKIFSGENVHEVKPGSLVTIPPMTDHWMEPDEGSEMTGLLWYHEDVLTPHEY